MSFLTPLYLLGALAVALPILAHLFRRTPPRRRDFSSVMLLDPSVPQVTRRNRIEHWPLLCLRGLVLCLLALAFSRPFWSTPVAADGQEEGRWIAVLLDTSASMQREGLWDEARRRLEAELNAAALDDRVGVFTFDGAPRLAWSWEAWSATEPARRAAAVMAALSETSPGWGETNLGQALLTAAEALESRAGRAARQAQLQIIVISDLQAGSRLDALQGAAWPDELPVRLVRVGASASPDNAGLQPALARDGQLRLRVTNAAGAVRDTFQIGWHEVHVNLPAHPARALPEDGPTGDSLTEPADTGNPRQDSGSAAGVSSPREQTFAVTVPAGQSRLIRAPAPPEGAAASRLILSGDDHAFDNAAYLTLPQRQHIAIVCLGRDARDDPAGHRFYIEPMFADTPERAVTIVDWDFESSALPATESPTRLILLTDEPSEAQLPALRRYLHGGGLIVYVVRTPEAADALAALAGSGGVAAEEAPVDGFALLTDIDFEHPAFTPFSDPRYSDFRRLRFWRHRRIDVTALPQCRVLARFDDGNVAIGELRAGAGRIVFFASGWSREDSQLAVWSKFVPLMNGLLELGGGVRASGPQRIVGQTIPLAHLRQQAEAPLVLCGPDGSVQPLSADADVVVDRPGIYTVSASDGGEPLEVFALNLSPAESRTEPMAIEQLEALGVRLFGDQRAAAAMTLRAAHELENAELEARQRLWRWLLVAAIALLVVETIWAGRVARRSASLPQ